MRAMSRNIVSTIHGVFSLSLLLSFCPGYFYPRTGYRKVLKFLPHYAIFWRTNGGDFQKLSLGSKTVQIASEGLGEKFKDDFHKQIPQMGGGEWDGLY